MKNNDKIFHDTVGHNNPPSPFQMIGGGVKRVVRSAGRKVLKTFVDPAIRVSKMKDARMNKMKRDLESGDYL